jgi:predicted  nucleic acid-binding Zn-ribbon protein
MSLHINRFVDRIKAHESRAAREFSMPMQDAKDLHADITKLLLQVQELREQADKKQEAIQVEFTGGSF